MSDFGYEEMLKINRPFNPSDDELNQLAKFMTDEPKRIPAGYTYLGQFIDHDISLDSATVARIPPWNEISVANISNKRTPFFNLETLYGLGCIKAELLQEKSKSFLRLGETINGDFVEKDFPIPNDLPRMKNSPTAQIVDERNDENLAVAQTQVAFIKFHNAVVNHLGGEDTTARFEEARKIVTLHYQWIILKDFLPKIIKQSVLNQVLSEGNRFYFPERDSAFMPLEFSVAAYRAGHSLVRNSYNWNRLFNDDPKSLSATIFELSLFTGRGKLDGKNNLVRDWLVNWNWFYDLSNHNHKQKFNFAPRIDTKIAPLLGFLPNSNGEFPGIFGRETSLAAMDLYRARALSLPSGQDVAKIILGTKERILKPEQLANLLPENLKYVFSIETPLWFYLLAEAEIEENGQTLGEVGSRIVAETFVALLRLSKPSILEDEFKPKPEFCGYGGKFGMPELLKFVAKGNKIFDELNPIGNA